MTADVRITPAVIGGYAVISFVAAVVSVDGTLTTRVLTALTASAVAAITAFVLMRLAHGLGPVALVAVVIGATRGIVLVALTGGGPVALRIVVSAVNAAIWVTALALFAAGRASYRTRYLAAVVQAADAQAATALATQPEVVRAQSTIDSIARTDASDGAAMRAAADALQREIADGLRPLSHRIWFSASDPVPHPRWGRLVHDAVWSFDVPVLPVVAVWFVAALVGGPVMFGTVPGLVGTVIDSVVLAAMLVLWSRPRSRPHPAWRPPLVLLACAVLPVAATQVVRVDTPPFGTPYVMRLGFAMLALGGLLVAASAIALAHADRERLLSLAESRGAGAPSHAVSSYLHSSLQAELTGLALQLRQAEPGSAEARETVQRLGALAGRSIADDFRAFRESPLDRIDRLVAAWDGIATLTVRIDPDVDGDDPRLGLVVQAVEEVTSNAVRHGGATSVAVVVAVDAAALVVDVRTDGAAREPVRVGMGTGWLASVAQDPPVVRSTATGAHLRLRL